MTPPKIYIAVHLFLMRGEEILFMCRANTGYRDGNYGLPAGHLEFGETAKEAMIREAQEEIGIILTPENLDVVYVQHRFRLDREYIDLYIKATQWSGEVQNMESEKCSELRWTSLHALPENTIPVVRHAIENIQRGIHFDDIGEEKI